METDPDARRERQVVMSRRPWILLVILLAVSACVDVDITLCTRGDTSDETPRVEVDDIEFEVEVADTLLLRERGLTGRRYLEERKGMLFIPDGPYVGDYWMKGMLFPLDFIWIGRDCRVVDLIVYASIPPPGTPDDEIRRYRSYPSAGYTLEVNAGEVDRFGIRVGDKVRFRDIDDHC